MLESREFLIAAAYAITAIGLGGLIVAIAVDHSALRRALSRFGGERKP